MGKVVTSTFISLDGIVNHMDRWHFDFVDDDSNTVALDQLSAADAMLMGRKTYESYAAVWPSREDEYSNMINAIPKYVASTTLTDAAWQNTTVISGDLVDRVAELRRDMNILMHGYGPVARTLLAHDLLDELHLWVHPVLAGVGDREDMLFQDGQHARLHLDNVQPFASGVVMLSYSSVH